MTREDVCKHWKEQLTDYWGSDFSISEYCELKELSYESARHWVRIFEKKQTVSYQNYDIKYILDELADNYPALNSCLADIQIFFETLVKVFTESGKLLICGNGGSASDAQHIVGELMKDFTLKRAIPAKDKQKLHEMFPDGTGEVIAESLSGALPAISLSGEQALNSALVNDVDSEISYAQQVYGLCNSEDALLALSTSGNSANVINAVKTAKLKGAVTLAITGQRESKLSTLCDVVLLLPASETYRIQEFTLPVYHAICRMLELAFWSNSSREGAK